MSPSAGVRVWTEERVIPTYLPSLPDKNPMFLEKRVYQGSCGKVYPLPFTDRIAETPVNRAWHVVWLENEFLRVMILPEIGGRIQALEDKTNGYHIVYRQSVIKPALVGLAGPWISGGIEFNWPQHHRPATFLPVEYDVQEDADGSQTVWLGDHDPLTRMKGMHGVCLRPGRAYLELRVRVENRTSHVQTFLWWANVAVHVHEGYQSFFPPEVSYVADHARRSMSTYPRCRDRYYGVDYARRAREGVPTAEVPTRYVPPHCRSETGHDGHSGTELLSYTPDDLSWYANIPTPCSYMCLGTRAGFFGGYDHFRQAGFVHYANPHLSPGKKQWTWGNHEFGYAWDRHLTDHDGPYIELMAGVYTDNQPDFSFLQPGEIKSWSQYWYPIQQIGPVQQANLSAAVSLRCSDGSARIGIAVTRPLPRARVLLTHQARPLFTATWDLVPGAPKSKDIALPPQSKAADLRLEVVDADGCRVISYQPIACAAQPVPEPATEPSLPEDVASNDELYLIGLHLDQYRHATRCPTLYWRAALARDPGDARCNVALGRWHLQRGEFSVAETLFRRAIERLTARNPNPYDGEAYYQLGVCLRYQRDALDASGVQAGDADAALALSLERDAYALFYKATWNQAWSAASYHALAEFDCRRGDWSVARDHLERSLAGNRDSSRVRNLLVMVLRQVGLTAEAEQLLAATLATDPLDVWARFLAGRPLGGDLSAALDAAHDCARAGFVTVAIDLLTTAAQRRAARPAAPAGAARHDLPDQSWGTAPLIDYTLGWWHRCQDHAATAQRHFRRASRQAPDWCFPARLEEMAILAAAMRHQPQDPRAPYYLGNLLYDRHRFEEAIALWEQSAKLDPQFSVVWRNLGVGYFNVRRQPRKARAAYDRARRAAPHDARLLYERDQLGKRLGETPTVRLRRLERNLPLVAERDDLTIELAALHNQMAQPVKALRLLEQRRFQPWEGGEGLVLAQYVRTRLALGRRSLADGDAAAATEHFRLALVPPTTLGEARHLLANPSDVRYWLGCALNTQRKSEAARHEWELAATFQGDFQEMHVQSFSEMTYYSARAWERLGEKRKARQWFRELRAYARQLATAPAGVDYFATSLPTMLLFSDDLAARQTTTARFLEAQALLGLGRAAAARVMLRDVLRRDPNHAPAADLLAELPSLIPRSRS